MNKRLKLFLEFKGSSLAELERNIGVGSGTLSKAVKNNNSIGVDKVVRILQFYEDLSAEWLLRGKGEMLLNSRSLDSVDSVRIEMLERQVCQLSKERDNCWSLIQRLLSK